MTVQKSTIGTIGSCEQDFDNLGEIGTGGSATVFRVRSKKDGFEKKCFALKKINKKGKHGEDCTQRIENEVEIHRQLQNDFVLKFYDYFEQNGYFYIVLELCENGSLQDLKRPISEKEACELIQQVIHGVIFLHSQSIIHRDLSLKNLMLTEEGEIKIADFGLATKFPFERTKHKVVGTLNFMAPEVFDGYYDFKTDCWSVGCVLYALLYGAPPFNSKNEKGIKKRIKTANLRFPGDASKEAKELLMNMLEKEPSKRINIRDSLNYAFFQKYKTHEEAPKKNGDSGLSSLSSSPSLNSQYSPKIYDPNCRSYVKSRHENVSKDGYFNDYKRTVNQLGKSERSKVKGSYSSSRPTKCESSMFGNHFKDIIPSLPSYQVSYNPSSSSQVNPDYREYKNFEKVNEICSQMYSFRHDNGCITSTKIQDSGPQHSSHSREYCVPGMNSIHKSDSLQKSLHKGSESYHPVRNHEREKENIQMKSIQPSESFKDVLTPLTTTRLKKSKPRVVKNGRYCFSILNDGTLSLEILKAKGNEKYVSSVYFFSHDGMVIRFYKPENKIPHSSKPPEPKKYEEVQFFTLENLPERHRKKYEDAKRFVDAIKARTRKVIVHLKFAKCAMMENGPNPDYQVLFYDGYVLTEIKGKIRIKDQNNQDVTDNANNVEFRLREFKKLKEECEFYERVTTARGNPFPVIVGSKPCVSPSSSVPKGTYTTTMEFPSKFMDSSTNQNYSQKSSLSLLSKERSIAAPSKKMTENLLDLKRCQLYGEEWARAEYKDGIVMFVNRKKDDEYFFLDGATSKRLQKTPDLINRFDHDSRKVLHFVKLSKETKIKS